jgi:hypothetical protein
LPTLASLLQLIRLRLFFDRLTGLSYDMVFLFEFIASYFFLLLVDSETIHQNEMSKKP